MNAATATPAGAHNDMGLRIAALVNKVEAARRRACDLSNPAENALDEVMAPFELASLEGRGIDASELKTMWAGWQAGAPARALALAADGEVTRAVAVLLHALQALHAGWANG